MSHQVVDFSQAGWAENKDKFFSRKILSVYVWGDHSTTICV